MGRYLIIKSPRRSDLGEGKVETIAVINLISGILGFGVKKILKLAYNRFDKLMLLIVVNFFAGFIFCLISTILLFPFIGFVEREIGKNFFILFVFIGWLIVFSLIGRDLFSNKWGILVSAVLSSILYYLTAFLYIKAKMIIVISFIYIVFELLKGVLTKITGGRREEIISIVILVLYIIVIILAYFFTANTTWKDFFY